MATINPDARPVALPGTRAADYEAPFFWTADAKKGTPSFGDYVAEERADTTGPVGNAFFYGFMSLIPGAILGVTLGSAAESPGLGLGVAAVFAVVGGIWGAFEGASAVSGIEERAKSDFLGDYPADKFKYEVPESLRNAG